MTAITVHVRMVHADDGAVFMDFPLFLSRYLQTGLHIFLTGGGFWDRSRLRPAYVHFVRSPYSGGVYRNVHIKLFRERVGSLCVALGRIIQNEWLVICKTTLVSVSSTGSKESTALQMEKGNISSLQHFTISK